MTDEERFKVGLTVNTLKFLNLVFLNDENQIAANENTEEVSFEQ